VKFLCEEMDEKTFLTAAKDATPFKTNERRCEAFFYAGSLREMAGDEDGARQLFRKCVETNVRSFIEYQSASLRLKR
jgi:lipoprotein NlpI